MKLQSKKFFKVNIAEVAYTGLALEFCDLHSNYRARDSGPCIRLELLGLVGHTLGGALCTPWGMEYPPGQPGKFVKIVQFQEILKLSLHQICNT